jgi:hypothetical protein
MRAASLDARSLGFVCGLGKLAEALGPPESHRGSLLPEGPSSENQWDQDR